MAVGAGVGETPPHTARALQAYAGLTRLCPPLTPPGSRVGPGGSPFQSRRMRWAWGGRGAPGRARAVLGRAGRRRGGPPAK